MELEQICQKAAETGRAINLDGCRYSELFPQAQSYYYFLAGFVRVLRLTHILELGTRFGGSIMAMSKGVPEEAFASARLVTVDITRENSEGFAAFPHIKRIQGDIMDKNVIREAVSSFDRGIDILFIDAVHEYDYVKKNIYEYGAALKPRFIILDDIRYNSSMVRVWRDLTGQFKDKAFEVTPLIAREGNVGFGILECGTGYRASYSAGPDLALCSARIRANKFISRSVPGSLKKLIRKVTGRPA